MIDYDLHIHSNSSDGLLKPIEIFKQANLKKLKGISITDHDTVSSIETSISIAKEQGIDFVPGVELSCDFNRIEVHLLGYFIDYTDKPLLTFLKDLQDARYKRIENMILILNQLGYKILIDDLLEIAGLGFKSIGRPHIARLLVKKGYFKDKDEVFEKLLKFGKPAYIERYRVPINDGIKKIIKSGGIPVLAHPKIIRGLNTEKHFIEFIKKIKAFGIIGIEAYHTKQDIFQTEYLKRVAKVYGLIITGGSDCHGVIEDGKLLLGRVGITSLEFEILRQYKS